MRGGLRRLAIAVAWLTRVVRRWRWAILAAFVALLGAWLYSHLYPSHFGDCTEIPVRFGPTPTVRDCQPHGPTDFAVPLVILLILLLLSGPEGDIRISVPWLGEFERKHRVEAAATVVRQEVASLDERGDALLEGLRPLAPSPSDEEPTEQ